jgi:hypothetical protein
LGCQNALARQPSPIRGKFSVIEIYTNDVSESQYFDLDDFKWILAFKNRGLKPPPLPS